MNFKYQFTILVISVLSSSIALVSTPAFAQTTGSTGSTGSGNSDSDFNQFLTCLFDKNANGSVSETEIRSALGTGSSTDEPTESEIRDCFSPIYITDDASDEGEDSGTTSSSDEGEDSGTTSFKGVAPQSAG